MPYWRGKSVLHLSVRWVMLATAVQFAFYAHPLFANPVGASVVNGAVNMQTTGNTLAITASDRSIINWQGFSIGAGETTQFIQPTVNASVLNRVTSGDASQIMGALQANGQVYLINPNGVFIGNGATINVGSFLASTANVSDESFMRGGNLTFTEATGAGIVNRGTITANQGDVFLLAKTVENTGTIQAAKGTVGLMAGTQFFLKKDETGAVKVKVVASSEGSATGVGVANSGTIEALQAQLEAQGNVYALAINQSGIIRATGVSRDASGTIVLSAPGGMIRNTGTMLALNRDGSGGRLSVSGGDIMTEVSSIMTAAGTGVGDSAMGGQIEISAEKDAILSGRLDVSAGDGAKGGRLVVTGERVGLFDGKVNASGGTGGGEVLLGGDYQGVNPLVRNAETMVMTSDSSIVADATVAGDGGKVILWSNEYTGFYGDISAKGGVVSGNGGFVETSSKDNLQAFGLVTASAVNGQGGEWLLDPYNLTISTSTTSNAGSSPNFVAAANDAVVQSGPTASAGSISAGLSAGTSITVSTGNVAGSQAGNITVTGAIGKTAGANATLTLNANGSIDIQSGGAISSTTGTLGLTLNAGFANGGDNTVVSTSSVTINDTIGLNGGNLTINNVGTGSITLNANIGGATTAAVVTANLTSGGAITQTSGVFTATGTTTLAAGSGQAINLSTGGTPNNFGTVVVTSGGAVTLSEADAITFGAVTASGNFNLTSGGAATFNNAVNLGQTGGSFNATITGAANINNTITANGVTISPTGALTISSAGTILSGGAVSLGGSAISTGANITTTADAVTYLANTTLTAPGIVVNSAGGDIIFSGTLLGAQSLGLTAGVGNILFSGVVGATPLTTVTINSANNVTANGAFSAASLSIPALTGSAIFNGNLNLTTGLTTTAGAYNISILGATQTIAGATSFLNTGAVTIGQAGGTSTFTGGLVATAPSGVALLGTVATTGTPMTLGDAGTGVTLGAATTLNSGTGAINVNGALAGGGFGLTLQSGLGTGTVTIAGAISNLGSLTTTSAAYNVLVTGGGTIAGATSFLNTGAVTIGGAGLTTTFTGGLVATAPSAVTLLGTVATTDSIMTLGDAGTGVTLAANAALNSGSGAINVNGALAGGGFGLTLQGALGTGTVTIAGAISNLESLTTTSASYNVSMTGAANTIAGATTFNNLGTLTIGQALGTTTFTGGLVATAPSGVTLLGTVATTDSTMTLGDAGTGVTLGAATTLNSGSGAINVNGTLAGGVFGLTLQSPTGTGTVTIGGAISNLGSLTTTANAYDVLITGGGTITAATSFLNTGALTIGGAGLTTTFTGGLVATAPSGVTLLGTVATTGTTMTLGDAGTGVTLGAATTLNSGTGAINVNGALAGGGFGLTLQGASGTGAVTIAGAISNLGSLTTTSAAYNVSMTGAANTIAGATTFNNLGTLTIGQASGTSTFTGGLVATAPSGITLLGTVATTDSTMTLGDAGTGVTLGAATTLKSGTGVINVNGALTGVANGLAVQDATVGSTGAVNITAGIVSLGSLTTFGGLSNYAVSITGASNTIAGETTFNNTGTLTLGDGSDTINFTGGVVATAPSSKTLNGTITAAGVGLINLGSTGVSVTGTTTVGGTSTGAITLGSANLANGVTLTVGTGIANAITLGSVSGTAAGAVSNLMVTSTGAVILNGAIGTNIGAVNVTSGTLNIGVDSDITSDGLVSLAGTSGIQTAGSIATSADNVTFTGPTTLTGSVDINTGSTGGDITFLGPTTTLTGAGQNLNLTAGTAGNVVFGGTVGAARLGAITINSALDVTAEAITAASFVQTTGQGTTTFNGAQNYNTSTGLNVVTDTIALSAAVTTTAGGVVTLNANNAGGAAAGTLTIGASDIISDGAVNLTGGSGITTSGDVTTTGDLVNYNSATTLAAGVLVDTTSAGVSPLGATVTFGSTLDGGSTLGLTAGTAGNVVFTGAVGATTRLGAITISSANNVTAAAVTASSLAQTTGNGTTTLNGAVNVNGVGSVNISNGSVNLVGTLASTAGGSGAVTLNSLTGSVTVGGAITSAGGATLTGANGLTQSAAITANGAGANVAMTATTGTLSIGAGVGTEANGTVTVNAAAGALTIAAAGDINSGGAVNLTAGSGISTAGDVTTTGDAVNYNSATTLTGGVLVDTTSGSSAGATVTFANTLNGAQSLGLTAGTGDITFTGAVGTTRLGAVAVVSGATVQALSTFNAASFTQNAGSVATTFGGLVDLTGAFDFTGTALNINGVGANLVSGLMEVTNAGLFTTASGANLTIGTEFVQNGAGLNSLGGNLVSTSDGFSFLRGVTLNSGITMTTGLGSGDDILFSSTLTGTTAGSQSLGLTAGLGNITFTGAVGTTRLGAVTVGSGASVQALSTFKAASFTQNAGSVATTFGGLVDLTGAFDFTGTALNINGVGANLVSGLMEVTNAGLFTTASGANLAVGTEFVQNGAGLNSLGGNIASTADGISLATGVTLSNGITMNTGLGSGDDILFSSTLTGTTAGSQSLGLTAGLGNITFTGAVGTTRLGVVTVVSGQNLTESAGFGATTLDLTGLTGTASFPGTGGTGILDLSGGLTVGGGAKNISITGGTTSTPNTIAGITTFDNTGTLTIGSTATDATLFVGGLTATSPTSGSGAGFVRTAGGVVDLGAVTFTAATTIDTTNDGAVAAGADLTLVDALGGQNLTLIGGTGGTVDLAGATVANLTVTADEIDFSGGASTITSTGGVLLQGATAGTTIGVAGAAGTLQITAGNIAAIANGATSITIGNSAQTGLVTVDAVGFVDPVVIRSSAVGGNVTVDGLITATDDASVTLQGDTLAVNAGVTTVGQDVILEGGGVGVTLAGAPISTTATAGTGIDSGFITISADGLGTINLDAASTLTTIGASNTIAGLNESGGAGGDVTITAETGLISILSLIDTSGGDASGGLAGCVGGVGGNVVIGTTAGSISLADITTSGGDALAGASLNGGDAGSVTVSSSSGNTVTLNSSDINAIGGAGVGTGISGTGSSIVFNNPVLLAVGLTTITTTGSTGGDITFGNALDGGQSLTLEAGTGSVSFEGIVGATPLTTVTVTSAAAVTAEDSFTAGTLALNTVTGLASFAGNLVLTTLSVGGGVNNFSMLGTANSVTTATSFGNSGTLQIGQASASSIFTGGVNTSGVGGVVTLNGTILSGNTAQVYGAVTLGANTTLNTQASTGVGDITLGAVTGGGFDLSLSTGNGITGADVSGTSVSGVGTLGLSNIGGTAGFSGPVSATTVSLANVSTANFQGDLTATTLSVPSTVVNFSSTGTGGIIVNAVSFANSGTLTLGQAAGTQTFTGGVNTSGVGGVVTLKGTILSGNTAQVYGAVTLGANTTLNTQASTGAGDITLGAVTGGGFNLSLSTGNGIAGADVSGTSVSGVGTLGLSNIGGTAGFSGPVSATTVSLANVSTANFQGALTATTLSVPSTVVNFSSTGTGGIIVNAVSFANTGTLTLGQAAGTQTFTGGLTATAPSGVTLLGTVATTDATMTLGDAGTGVTLGAATTLKSGTGVINVNGALTAGAFGLSLQDATAGSTGAVSITGGIVSLASLATFGGSSNYAVSITGAANTITAATTFNNLGALTIGQASGLSTFTGGLTATAPSGVTLLGTVATTDATMTLGDVGTGVTLGAATTLKSGTGVINVNGALTGGANGLTLQDSTLGSTGAVNITGGIVSLASLATFGGSSNYAVSITGTVNTIAGVTTFNNTGTLTLGDATGDSTQFTAGVIATAPSSKLIAGTISALGTGVINLGTTPVTVTANTTVGGSSTGTITLGNATIANGATLTVGTGIANAIIMGTVSGVAGGTVSNLAINTTGAASVGVIGTDMGSVSATAEDLAIADITTSGAITVTADGITPTGITTSTAGGDITIRPLTAGTAIGIGTGAVSGGLDLGSGLADVFTSGRVIIGSTALTGSGSGEITIGTVDLSDTGYTGFSLLSQNATATFNADSVLTLPTGTDIRFQLGSGDVNGLAEIYSTSRSPNLVSAGGTLRFVSVGSVSLYGSVDNLQTSTSSGVSGGLVYFNEGTLNVMGNQTAAGEMLIGSVNGDLNLSSQLTGTKITAYTGQNFNNTFGSTAINLQGGRGLVYSTSPNDNTPKSANGGLTDFGAAYLVPTPDFDFTGVGTYEIANAPSGSANLMAYSDPLPVSQLDAVTLNQIVQTEAYLAAVPLTGASLPALPRSDVRLGFRTGGLQQRPPAVAPLGQVDKNVGTKGQSAEVVTPGRLKVSQMKRVDENKAVGQVVGSKPMVQPLIRIGVVSLRSSGEYLPFELAEVTMGGIRISQK